VPSSASQNVDFTVIKAQTSATFTLQVNQVFVAKALREEYVKRLSTIMGITSNRTSEKIACIGIFCPKTILRGTISR
jgi:hypothetical protein